MTTMIDLDRRLFLSASLAAGGALIFGVHADGAEAAAATGSGA